MNIATRVRRIQQLIHDSTERYQRPATDIQLLAVSKGQPSTAIREAFAAGLRNFGENYLQEAQTKMQTLTDLDLCWHFIGPIQTNKTAVIAQHFSWVHSVSRAKVAELLAQHRPAHLPALNICLQVNLDQEASKSGAAPEELKALITQIINLPHLKLRGLMSIPKPLRNEEEQYRSLLRLTSLLEQLNTELGLKMDTLSMGMSDDLVAAVHAGSTILRIGRAIFGERQAIRPSKSPL